MLKAITFEDTKEKKKIAYIFLTHTKVLWYNKVIPNNLYEQIQDGDLAVSKEEKENHNLKVGDFVKVYIAPEKTVGSFKIIFD